MINPDPLYFLLIFLPALVALSLLLIDRKAEELMRRLTLISTVVSFGLSLALLSIFDRSSGEMQLIVKHGWIPTWNIYYQLGVDGLSLPLILLTTFVFMLSAVASWSIKEKVRGYLMLFLLLETGVLGVFLALDFFLFYVFWEVMLLPMYFLIGIWGGPRKEYAAIKFFLYTLFGGALMLIAMLMFYFNSSISVISKHQNIFDLTQLAKIGQAGEFSPLVQIIAFWLLFVAFAIKLPTFPFHTWLPDAHVEAPTPISMILAGVLLKMGGYGILRVAFPLCPLGAQYACLFLVALGVFSIIYGALAAMAQSDFKRLVAYSSVSHMGYVLIGVAVWKISELTGQTLNSHLWSMGMTGAIYQMIGHGITSAGMFFMVGVLYDRVHQRDMNKFGGLVARMPLYCGLSFIIFFAGLGLPALCGFIGEVLVVLSVWNFHPALAVLAAFGVVMTACYILWTIQRVYLGPMYYGEHADALTDLNSKEKFVGITTAVAAVVLGIFPNLLIQYISPTTDHLTSVLAESYSKTHPAGTQVSGIALPDTDSGSR